MRPSPAAAVHAERDFTLSDEQASRRTRADPPFGAAIGLVRLKELALQIWVDRGERGMRPVPGYLAVKAWPAHSASVELERRIFVGYQGDVGKGRGSTSG